MEGGRSVPIASGRGFMEHEIKNRPECREMEAKARKKGRSRNNPYALPGSQANQISEGTFQGF